MEVIRRSRKDPFFSICIPQYNRTAFLIEACKSLVNQTFKNFEVCISDDCSTDGKEEELIKFLEESGLSFVFRKLDRNARYDGNLRASIGLSEGRYCFLLGNDDALASPETLQQLYDDIQEFGPVGVVITNFADYETGKIVRRMRMTGLLGAGPKAAADNYRNVSFVSGVVLDSNRSKGLATSNWDGSEMYQMYLMSRIVAEGGKLLGIDRVVIRKDIQIVGAQVDSYAVRPRLRPCPIIERKHTFHLIGRLVVDAIEPHLEQSIKQAISESVLRQLVIYTYPFWIFEYRRVQSWNYSAGICLGMRPRNFIGEIKLGWLRRFRLNVIYFFVSFLGLSIPVRLFDRFYSKLYALAKSKW
jgi:glycosyltransferase involved in cell wall biosynthesis